MGIDMNNTKFNRTSSYPMDIINTARIDTGGKAGRGLMRGKEFPPLFAHFVDKV